MKEGPPQSINCERAQNGFCDYGKKGYYCAGKPPNYSIGFEEKICIFHVCKSLEVNINRALRLVEGMNDIELKIFIKNNFSLINVETDDGNKDLVVVNYDGGALDNINAETFKGRIGVDEDANIYLPPHHYVRDLKRRYKYNRNREFEFSFKEFMKFSDFLDKAFAILRKK